MDGIQRSRSVGQARTATREALLRIEEVSEWTGVPENTLRFWRHEKRGPKSAKLGRRVVYRESDVQAWLDEQFGTAI